MTSINGQKKNEILTTLKTDLLELTEFEDSVFIGFISKVETSNAILIHLNEDDIDTETTDERIHEIAVDVVIKSVCDIKGDQEQEALNFIDLVGVVEDKLENIAHDEPNWEYLRSIKADYSFKAGEALVYHNCKLTVLVRKEWTAKTES